MSMSKQLYVNKHQHEVPSETMKIYGPGMWHDRHHGAARAQKTGQIDQYLEWSKHQIESIPCENCRNHAIKYTTVDYPIENFKNNIFKYEVDFHNFVNHRLGYPIMSLEEAQIKYGLVNLESQTPKEECQSCQNKTLPTSVTQVQPQAQPTESRVKPKNPYYRTRVMRIPAIKSVAQPSTTRQNVKASPAKVSRSIYTRASQTK